MTNLYLSSQGYPTGLATPTTRGTWTTGPAAAISLVGDATVDGGASSSSSQSEQSSSSGNSYMLFKAVSSPLSGAQTISGTLNVMFGVVESNANNNYVKRLHVYVMASDGSVRGTLLANYTDTVEYPTTAQGQALASAQTLSSVSAQDGDRIVAEIGFQEQHGFIGLVAGTQYCGGTSGTDLSAGDANVTTHPSFLNFSATLAFKTPTARVSQETVEVLIAPDSSLNNARVSQLAIEVLIKPLTIGETVTTQVIG